MQLTVRDISRLLNVSQRTVYRWIKSEEIPAYRVHDQYRFNRFEIMDWATAKRIPVSPEIFNDPNDQSTVQVRIGEALKVSGIHYRIEGRDKESVLRAVVQVMQLPAEIDRDFMLQGLLAREALGSTGIGEGIAIPHARNPIVLHVPQPIISLCFLEQAVDFQALDGQPVHAVFMLMSTTVRSHLQILSRLAFALKDEQLKKVLLEHGSREAILKEFDRVEGQLRV